VGKGRGAGGEEVEGCRWMVAGRVVLASGNCRKLMAKAYSVWTASMCWMHGLHAACLGGIALTGTARDIDLEHALSVKL